jgi:hypothetical protein
MTLQFYPVFISVISDFGIPEWYENSRVHAAMKLSMLLVVEWKLINNRYTANSIFRLVRQNVDSPGFERMPLCSTIRVVDSIGLGCDGGQFLKVVCVDVSMFSVMIF